MFSLHLSCLSVYQSETCNNDNCAGTGNIHSVASRNKHSTILWVFIIQDHRNLISICEEIHYMQMSLNLRPGKRSLVAKVEDEAGVHDAVTLDQKNGFT